VSTIAPIGSSSLPPIASAPSAGPVGAPAVQAGSHSAKSVVTQTQTSSLYGSFQNALAGEDLLKMMMALILLDALSGGRKDKEEDDKALMALALLGAVAGSRSGGAFMSSYSAISQVGDAALTNMSQQLHACSAYAAQTNAAGGSMLNVMA